MLGLWAVVLSEKLPPGMPSDMATLLCDNAISSACGRGDGSDYVSTILWALAYWLITNYTKWLDSKPKCISFEYFFFFVIYFIGCKVFLNDSLITPELNLSWGTPPQILNIALEKRSSLLLLLVTKCFVYSQNILLVNIY